MSTIENKVTEAARERVHDAVAEALGSAYDCLRVWAAWGVGTMSQRDFVLVAEDADRVGEIADAAIAALTAPAEPVKNAFGMTLPVSTPEDEKQALRDMLDDARAELEAVRIALGVPEEPHQSLYERLLERAREVANVDSLRAYKRDWEKVIRARDYAAGTWGLRELEGLSGENTVDHLVYLLLNERHSPRKRKLSMRERKRPRGRIRRAL